MDLKRAAAERAVEVYVESGMVLGLGTGSTAVWAVRRVGELLSGGDLKDIRGIPTSEETADLAREVGIPLIGLSEALPDAAIDGADEVGPGLALIKGRGGALLREKIVASATTDGIVVVVDGSKLVDELDRGPLPVEVEPFGWPATRDALAFLGCDTELRMEAGEPFVTDGGHYIIDCGFGSIPDPEKLETELRRIPGALENGLFVGLTRATVVARENGKVEIVGAKPHEKPCVPDLLP